MANNASEGNKIAALDEIVRVIWGCQDCDAWADDDSTMPRDAIDEIMQILSERGLEPEISEHSDECQYRNAGVRDRFDR